MLTTLTKNTIITKMSLYWQNNWNCHNEHQAPLVVASTFFPCRRNKWETKLWAESEYRMKTKGDIYPWGIFYLRCERPEEDAIFYSSMKQLSGYMYICTSFIVWHICTYFFFQIQTISSQSCLLISTSLTGILPKFTLSFTVVRL